MPYSSNSALPPGVRGKYSPRCQAVFRRVFNANHSSGEGKAFRVAHTAARRCMEAKSVTLPAETKFNILTGMLNVPDTKEYNGEERRRVKTVASSTLTDRQGDQMTLKALNQMAESAQGMTIFLNHSYKVPEDVFGVVSEAKAIQRGDVWDLDFDIDVEEDNPRAVQTHKSIIRGVKLGTSVGAIVKDAYKEDDHIVIDDVVLLEASIVGIPANPRSFVQYAVKALEDAEAAEAEGEAPPPPEEPEMAPPATEPAPEETETSEGSETPADQEGQPTSPESPDGDAPAPEAAKATPSATIHVPEEAAAIDWNRVDDGDQVGDEAKALLSLKQADFTTLLKMVETATSELVTTKKALWDAQKALTAAERERDEANANVALAKQFVQKLSELPLGRRASYAGLITDFNEKFSGVYDPDFIKMLTTGDSNG